MTINDDTNDDEITQSYAKIYSNVKKSRFKKGLSQMDFGLEIEIKSVAFFQIVNQIAMINTLTWRISKKLQKCLYLEHKLIK